MHPIFHTEGIIIGSRNSKEADKYFWIFSRDFGVIRADARSVRKHDSKLRTFLSDFSRAKISLVKTKIGWRITSVQGLLFLENAGILAKEIFSKSAKLLQRLAPPDEKHEELYEDIVSIFENKDKDFFVNDYKNIELVSAIRILFHLGYIEHNASVLPFATGSVSKLLLTDAFIQRRELVKTVNNSLRESHL
jgi:DNA repair protein RecO